MDNEKFHHNSGGMDDEYYFAKGAYANTNQNANPQEDESSSSSSDSDSDEDCISSRGVPPPILEPNEINDLTLCDDDGPSLLIPPPQGPEDGDYGWCMILLILICSTSYWHYTVYVL